MIQRFLLAALCLFSPATMLAQVRVELSFDQETYLPREPLYATVRIYNSSGQTLELGKDDHWLVFSVEATDGSIVKQFKPVDVEGEFTLPSAHRARKSVNLAEAYDLTKFGRYIVTATVRVPGWNENFTSGSKHFGISQGVNLWESAFGLPSENPDARPEIRKYQLVQANHVKALSLYVRVVDEHDTEVFSLFPLGPLLGLSKPDVQLDRWSNLHVFYQDGARTYRYSMITPDGLLLARQTWEITDDSRPALKPEKDGRIAVSGGIRRISGTDLPPPELLSENTRPAVGQKPAAAPAKATDAPEAKKTKKKK